MSDPILDAVVEFADNPEARCPCVVLVDTSGSMQGARIDALNEELNKRAAFFGVGVEGASMTHLASLCGRAPVKLTGLNFVEMFVWLSRSTQQVAKSKPGEQVALRPPGWGTV